MWGPLTYWLNIFNYVPIFLQQRSIVISTYALCGFANFGSMGIQLGALGSLIPAKKKVLSQVIVRAMIAGSVACFLTACIAGEIQQLIINSKV